MSTIRACPRRWRNLRPFLKVVTVAALDDSVETEKTEVMETCEEMGMLHDRASLVDPFATFGSPSLQGIISFCLFLVVLVYLIFQVLLMVSVQC